MCPHTHRHRHTQTHTHTHHVHMRSCCFSLKCIMHVLIIPLVRFLSLSLWVAVHTHTHTHIAFYLQSIELRLVNRCSLLSMFLQLVSITRTAMSTPALVGYMLCHALFHEKGGPRARNLQLIPQWPCNNELGVFVISHVPFT